MPPKPISPTTSAAAVPVTKVRFFFTHRLTRSLSGSEIAVTGSSANQRSTSSASAFDDTYRSPGRRDIAFRHTASSALSIEESKARGRAKAPAWTARNFSPASAPAIRGLFVSSEYRVAPSA